MRIVTFFYKLFPMTNISKKTVDLKDGRTCTIRSAVPSDAKDMINFKITIAETSKYLTLKPSEVNDTRWKLKSELKKVLDSPNAINLVAVVDGNIIGGINTFGQTRASLRHSVEFGIGIVPAWQGAGLGKILIQQLLNWAKANQIITRVELHVHVGNEGALALYEKLGFEHEGRRRNAIRYPDGSYMDDLIMSQMV